MTAYTIDFDFTSADQKAILGQLQAANYTLLGYKGAVGPNQVTAGVPTWFAVPFSNMFGIVDITYTPMYKIYVYNKSQIAANTTIQMQSISGEMPLGNALTFQADGSFVSGGVQNVPSDSLALFNSRPAGTSSVTVGLAGLVNLPDGTSQYLPFCAFTLNPQNSIVMKPLETILLVAAQLNLQSGNVQASVSAPGCTFSFSSSAIEYDLQVLPSSFAITNVAGTAPVLPVSSGSTIGTIINT